MPNWCENELTVSGPAAAVAAFVADAKGTPHDHDRELAIDFNRFIPYPQQFIDLDLAARKRRAELDAMPAAARAQLPIEQRQPKDGYNQGGYQWCVQHWGTKWNAADVSLKVEAMGHGWQKATFNFSTAWTPPTPVIAVAGAKHPGVELTLRYSESMAGFSGVFKVRKGEVVRDETTNG